MSVIATTEPTPAGPMVSAAEAAVMTDHTQCTSAQWNEAVLVRRFTEAQAVGALEEGIIALMREGIAAKSGHERDMSVLHAIEAVSGLIYFYESQEG